MAQKPSFMGKRLRFVKSLRFDKSIEETNETINEVVNQVADPVCIGWPDGQFNGLRGQRAGINHQ